MEKINNQNFKVVTLCGSTRYKEEFIKAAERLTFKGYIVLMPHVFAHAVNIDFDQETTDQFKQMHKQMIDMSDAILVINKDCYFGKSTIEEIKYAEEHGKKVFYEYVYCDRDCAHCGNCKADKESPILKMKEDTSYPGCPYFSL